MLARIRQLRTADRSVRVIAETLTSEGLKLKRGGRWHRETVRRIITRMSD